MDSIVVYIFRATLSIRRNPGWALRTIPALFFVATAILAVYIGRVVWQGDHHWLGKLLLISLGSLPAIASLSLLLASIDELQSRRSKERQLRSRR